MSLVVRMVLVLVAVCGNLVEASSSPCPTPIRVAFYELGLFYNPVTKTGIDKDVVEEIGRRTGCRFEPLYLNRSRIWMMLRDGSLDMTVSGIETPDRREIARFVPYLWLHNELVLRDGTKAPSSPEAFLADPNLRLGVVRSFKHGEAWDEWIARLRKLAPQRVIDASDSKALFAMLDAGRIDALLALPAVILAEETRYATQHRLQRLAWFPDQKKIDASIVLSRQRISLELYTLFARTVDEMRRDGTLLRIYTSYLGDRDAQAIMQP